MPVADAAAPTEPLPDAAWRRFIGDVTRERLSPLLAHATASGAWPATTAQLDEASVLGRGALGLVLELERELVGLHRDLGEAGIPMRILKGPAIARLDEADMSLRAFGDIDVLVRPEDIGGAVTVVEARGGTRRYPSRSRAYDRYVGKGSSFQFERNVEVDLHRTIAPGPFGVAVDLPDLFERHETMVVGPVTIEVLDRPGRFLHACYHVALGRARPRRSAQRDVVLTAPVDVDGWAEVIERARRWRGESVVASAISSVVADLQWQAPLDLASWAAAYQCSKRERRWLEAYHSSSRSSARLTFLGAGAGRGAGARVHYLAGLVRTPSGARAGGGDR